MSYSFKEESEDQLAVQDDLEMIRQDLIGELQAINQYQEHILSLGDEEAATMLGLIQNLDPAQAEKLERIL